MRIKELIELRHNIHRNAELSGKEFQTAGRIKSFILNCEPDEIITGLGGNGIAFLFKGKEKGKSIMFRAELDALPIHENNEIVYKSVNEGVAHKCGHDGHMAILAGLANEISHRNFNGDVVLLFQPSEETGEGALNVLKDNQFNRLNPDYIFAMHNLPGFPLGHIIIKEGTFAAASKGMIIELTGRTAHAAEPELGVNPAFFISDFIAQLKNVKNNTQFSDFVLVTIIHLSVGSAAFGTSPGNGKILLTLRSYRDDDMNKLTDAVVNLVANLSVSQSIKYKISFTEEFPATINNSDAVRIVKNAADELSLKLIEISDPFKWSEDFGHFTSKFTGAFFGLGSGISHPNLHNHTYDFPDELIEIGINIFKQIIKNVE